MNDKNQYQPAQKLIEEAKKVLVLLPPMPSEDMVNGALSLFLSLQNSKKEAQIGCSTEVNVSPNITGADKIKDSVGSRNLTIAFDYNEDDLDKVDYDVKNNGKFVLVIKPKENAPVPDISSVKFSYTGAEADLVITFGVFSKEELGKIYSEEKNFLDSANILSINISPRQPSYSCTGLHFLYNSYSELVAQLLEQTTLTPGENAAKNLLFGIYEATQSLTSAKTTADTFSSVAYLMRNGAQLPNQHRNVPRFAQAPFFDNSSPVPVTDNQTTPIITPQVNPVVPHDWKKPKIFRTN